VEGTGNGDPATICQWGDNKTRSGSHIFVAVFKDCRYLLDSAIISFFVPVVSKLLLPGEIVN
jgi:hypothetical protein